MRSCFSIQLRKEGAEMRYSLSVFHESSVRRLIMSEKKAGNDRLMVVTHSLGSTITFDTLSQLITDNNPFKNDKWTASNTASLKHLLALCPEDLSDHRMAQLAIYMFANQYALFSLGRTQDSFKTMTQAVASTQTAEPKGLIQVVAFTDLDDLLSFPVASQEELGVQISNVYLSNNSWSLFGEVTDPTNAHLGYFNNDDVIHISGSRP